MCLYFRKRIWLHHFIPGVVSSALSLTHKKIPRGSQPEGNLKFSSLPELVQNNEKLLKRAKRKFLHSPTLFHLLDLKSPLHKRYLSTLYCSSQITVDNGKTSSRYCKRTWCSICSPIRTAVRINNYKAQLEDLGDLNLTTLTMPNVSAKEIGWAINRFRAVFRQFRNNYKRKTGNVFRGIYNFEITHNHRSKLYHPHIHVIHEALCMETKHDEEHSGKKIKYEMMMAQFYS